MVKAGEIKVSVLLAYCALIFPVLLTSSTALRADDSGFLPSYEGLRFAPGEYGGKTEALRSIDEITVGITKIMVDQPEIFIAEDSAYKGLKPDDARALAEAFREAVIANIQEGNLAEEPGPDVVYLRLAITDIHLKKKKRRLLSYTPVGIVVHTAKSVATSDLMKKVDLVGVTIEVESLKSDTGEHLGSLVIKLAPPGEGHSDEASWEGVLANFDAISKQLTCRIRNSRLPQAERVNCKIIDTYHEG